MDEISLTLPADEAFRGVAHLVLSGLAVRLDLSYETLEDLELALDALLERFEGTEEIELRVQVLEGELRTLVGPFSSMRAELEATDDGSLGLSRILEAVTDRVEITERDGSEWVELTTRVDTVKAGRE